jgi:nucleotide-binding universal stress UspA family protein
MYRRILLCYDATTEGRNALREGAEIALAMQSETHLLAICRSNLAAASVPEGITAELARGDDDHATAILREGVEWLRARGLKAQGTLVFGDPLEHIPAAARRIGADLIVVGHRRRSRLERWWSDSDEESLLAVSPCSILAAVAAPAG